MKVTIELDEEMLEIDNLVQVSEETNGVVNQFKITVDELRKIINSSVNELQIDSGTLPSNAIRFRETDMGYEVFCEVPKQQWVINFNNDAIQVGFPKMVFHYHCRKKDDKSFTVNLTHIWAVKDQAVNNETEFFHFPYSHVNTDGKVCMGNNELPPIQSLTQLSTYHSFFLTSPFGNDYGAKTKLTHGVEQLFLETFANKPFDDEVLLTTQETFNDIVGRVRVNE